MMWLGWGKGGGYLAVEEECFVHCTLFLLQNMFAPKEMLGSREVFSAIASHGIFLSQLNYPSIVCMCFAFCQRKENLPPSTGTWKSQKIPALCVNIGTLPPHLSLPLSLLFLVTQMKVPELTYYLCGQQKILKIMRTVGWFFNQNQQEPMVLVTCVLAVWLIHEIPQGLWLWYSQDAATIIPIRSSHEKLVWSISE